MHQARNNPSVPLEPTLLPDERHLALVSPKPPKLEETPPRRRLQLSQPIPMVTVSLIAINCAIYLLMTRRSPTLAYLNMATIQHWGAIYGPAITHGQAWRLMTGGMIHFGLMHLVGNMVALWLGGALLESWIGGLAFSVIYLLSGLGASFAMLATHPVGIGAGASGSIMGIFGALLAIAAKDRRLRLAAGPRLKWRLAIFLAYPFVNDYLSQGTGNVMHLGGLFVGVILGAALSLEQDHRAVLDTFLSSLLLASLGLIITGAALLGWPKVFDVLNNTQVTMRADQKDSLLVRSLLERHGRKELAGDEAAQKLEVILNKWEKIGARWEEDGLVPAKYEALVADMRNYVPKRIGFYRALVHMLRSGGDPSAQVRVNELARDLRGANASLRVHFASLVAEQYGASCDRGMIQSCGPAGHFEEIAGQLDRAQRHFERVCGAHITPACIALARIELKRGETADASNLAGPLCLQGAGEACSIQARAEQALGGAGEAQRLHEQACHLGSMASCTALAELKERQGDVGAALALYQVVCGKGSAPSCYNAGRLQYSAHQTAEARVLFQIACRQGFGLGCAGWGKLESDSGNPLGASLFALACRYGTQPACLGGAGMDLPRAVGKAFAGERAPASETPFQPVSAAW